MDWPTVFLIVSLTITLLGFFWGIIKIFKKPKEDLSWKQPLIDFKREIHEEDKECKFNYNSRLQRIDKTLIEHGNKIIILEKDKEMLNKGIDDLKGELNKVSLKCDTILDKVIEYMSKE